jgi:hypothetical protein
MFLNKEGIKEIMWGIGYLVLVLFYFPVFLTGYWIGERRGKVT